MEKTSFRSIDEYIAGFPNDIQKLLTIVRETIHKAAPEAVETISYQMPAFRQGGVLVYFAAFKNHVGFFPTSSGVAAFQEKLTNFKTSKGTIQLPFDKPLPLDLITEITKFRVEEVKNKKGKY